MQRAFLNQLQYDEKLTNDGSCQSSKAGIVLLMDETVKLFDHGVSPNTYKVFWVLPTIYYLGELSGD